MRLGLENDQQLLVDSFDEFFARESSPDRVRAAEAAGFDSALWSALAATGALSMRVPPHLGGGGASLFDTCLVLERAGRHLAIGPIAGAIVAGSLLAASGGGDYLNAAVDGSSVITFVPVQIDPDTSRVLVEGGAHADAVILWRGDDLILVARPEEIEPVSDLGAGGFAWWPTQSSTALATGPEARRLAAAGVAEWRILTAAALVGLSKRSLELAAEYASQRVQFDRVIATFQGIAHPLADAATEVEGARLLVWDAIWRAGQGQPDAAATFSMAFAWAAEAATRATGTALHTFGGYGLALEYDVQLHQRRAKAWSAAAGDPKAALLDVADGLWGDASAPLPEVGDVPIDFGLGEEAEAFRQQVRKFLADHPPASYGCDIRGGWDGHSVKFHRALASAGLAFANWPAEYGGIERGPYEMTAMLQELYSSGVSLHPIANAQMVGQTILCFAQPELLDEVMPKLCRGEVITCLGYTEPESGSDVAAAKTRAVRDGDEWAIDGQKMFTSGADICQYVFLLTRTDPDVAKHKGLTMFLVPLNSEGIEIHPIHTLSGEKTNAVFYTGVRVPDRYRIGEVNGGMGVIGYALEIEHGGGGVGLFARAHADALDAAVEWARTNMANGEPTLSDPVVRTRLARVATRARISALFNLQSLWRGAEGRPNRGEGPMSKLFSAEAYIEDSSDLVDLAAPESLVSAGSAGALSDGELEFGYRLSAATSIYGGSSEIMRSIIAEAVLGMPRSRN